MTGITKYDTKIYTTQQKLSYVHATVDVNNKQLLSKHSDAYGSEIRNHWIRHSVTTETYYLLKPDQQNLSDMRQCYCFQNTLLLLQIPLTKEFHLVMICVIHCNYSSQIRTIVTFSYIFPWAFFSIDVVQYAVTTRARYTESPKNMLQNSGIRSHIPKGTKYFMWTCVREFFHSDIIRPPCHTSRNMNFHNHNLSAEENPSGIVLSCEHFGRLC